MEIIQITALGLAGAMLLVFVRQIKPEFGLLLGLGLGLIIFLAVLPEIRSVIGVLEDLAARADINVVYLNTVLRIIGVAYISEFAAQVCRDAGEGAVAAKIEFAGKVIIMVLAIPIVVAILEIILSFLP